MALESIDTFNNPYDPSTPFTNAYAYAAGLGLDSSNGSGRVTYNVHPSEDKWQGTPIGQVSIILGETFVHAVPGQNPQDPPVTPAVKMPTLQQLMAIPEFAQAFGTIAYIIDGFAINHPSFNGANIKPPVG